MNMRVIWTWFFLSIFI